MPTYPFMQVDAFTTTRLEGNPCAIVFEADSLSPETMQAIAREMNLSETAFVMRSTQGDVRARYFTPAEEIPLAGHPTIATTFALVETGRFALKGNITTLKLELQVGVIPVDIEADNGVIRRIMMTQKKPQFLKTYPAESVLPAFGLSPDDALPNVPIQTVSTGTPMLMVPLKSLDVLRRVVMDVPLYSALKAAGDFFSPHLFVAQGVTPAGNTFARQFGMPPDAMEDPYTGSATGGMGAYLWRYGLIDAPRFVAEQGHWMKRPGQGDVEIIGPREDIETVRVGGMAVTVLRGELVL